MTRKRELPKRLGLAFVLAAALAQAAWAQGAGQFDGEYVGELTLSGIINGDCTTPPLGSAYPLSILGGVVSFKYLPRFDTILTGHVDRNGGFKASSRTKSGDDQHGRARSRAATSPRRSNRRVASTRFRAGDHHSRNFSPPVILAMVLRSACRPSPTRSSASVARIATSARLAASSAVLKRGSV